MNALLLILVALAADPQAVVSGDKTAFVGIPAKISAAESVNAKKFVWLVTPEPMYVEKFNNGADLRLGHDEPATFYLTLVATSPDGGADAASWVLHVEAKAKAAVPLSGPTTSQRPASLAKQVAKELAKMNEPMPAIEFDAVGLLDEVTSSNLEADTKKVANCLLQEVRFLEGLPEAQPNVENIVKSTSLICKGSMTAVQWQGWTPWFEKLGDYLDDLSSNGELETIQDYADVLHDVADELKGFGNE